MGTHCADGHRKAESARMRMIGIYPTLGTLAKAAFQDKAERCYRNSLCQAHLVLGCTVIFIIHLILSQTFDMTTSQFYLFLKRTIIFILESEQLNGRMFVMYLTSCLAQSNYWINSSTS